MDSIHLLRTYLLALFLVVICSCSSPEKPPEQLFLENVMIREKGLFVLMGSKPMCSFDVAVPISESSYKTRFEEYLNNHPRSKMTYEEFKKGYLPKRLHFDELWSDWNAKFRESLSPCYKIISRKSPFNQESKVGFFINVPSAIHVLKEHKTAFLQSTGIPFDPEAILDEIEDDSSIFWEKVFQNHYLVGLLYGFGKRNAFIYDWGDRHNTHPYSQISNNQEIDNGISKILPKDLKIPLFGSFERADPILEKYRKERLIILQTLKGKDFYEEVIRILTTRHYYLDE